MEFIDAGNNSQLASLFRAERDMIARNMLKKQTSLTDYFTKAINVYKKYHPSNPINKL